MFSDEGYGKGSRMFVLPNPAGGNSVLGCVGLRNGRSSQVRLWMALVLQAGVEHDKDDDWPGVCRARGEGSAFCSCTCDSFWAWLASCATLSSCAQGELMYMAVSPRGDEAYRRLLASLLLDAVFTHASKKSELKEIFIRVGRAMRDSAARARTGAAALLRPRGQACDSCISHPVLHVVCRAPR